MQIRGDGDSPPFHSVTFNAVCIVMSVQEPKSKLHKVLVSPPGMCAVYCLIVLLTHLQRCLTFVTNLLSVLHLFILPDSTMFERVGKSICLFLIKGVFMIPLVTYNFGTALYFICEQNHINCKYPWGQIVYIYAYGELLYYWCSPLLSYL